MLPIVFRWEAGSRVQRLSFKNAFLFAVTTSLVLYFCLFKSLQSKEATALVTGGKRSFQDGVRSAKHPRNVSNICQRPSPVLFNPDMIPVYSQPTSVNCPKEFNKNSTFSGVAFAIRNGSVLERLVNLGVPCCYRSFFRDGDDRVKHLNSCVPIREKLTVIPSDLNYITITCRKNDNESYLYCDAFPLVHPKTPKKSSSPSTNAPRLNIAVIGLDGASHLNFQRQMPLSRDYLLTALDAISLDGFSVVGTGTEQNVVPMLTGFSLDYHLTFPFTNQFAAQCVNRYNHLEQCPFIWNNYSSSGYLTAFAEDWPNINEWWMNAFRDPPTDYYFRPYTVYMQQFAPPFTPAHFCFGPRLAFEAVLNFMESVREQAEAIGRPYFQFTWTSRLVHDHINSFGLGDAPLFRTLVKLKESGAMNSTVVMILGDHGHQQEDYAYTVSGQIEYRLPVAFIALPPWFSTRYPVEYRNLRDNSKRLTTGHDVFRTLEHLLDMDKFSEWDPSSGSGRGPGISLFKPIPESRTCLDAGILLQWCNLCHSKKPLNISDPLVKITADFLVASVNILSRAHDKNGSLCVPQSLRKVNSAYRWNRKDVFMELCNNGNGTGVITTLPPFWELFNVTKAELVGLPCELVDIVSVELTTNPVKSWYDGEVMVIRERGRVNGSAPVNKRMILTGDIFRQDWYSETGHCVPHAVKRYCICRKKVR